MDLSREGTKRYCLASLQAQGHSKDSAFEILRPKVIAQELPWVFSSNIKGVGRRPDSISRQVKKLRDEISRVWNQIDREGNPISADAYDPDIPVEIPESDESEEMDETETEEPPKPKTESEKGWFVSEWKRIRRWLHETSERLGTEPIDSLDSLRPVLAADRMIDFGISARMCVYAMCLHWPEVSRENAGVATMDFLAESESNPHGFHTLYGYVRKLALAAKGQDFGISLIGPSGTGKSRLAKQIAASIQTESHPDGLPYGETPMTPGATRGDLLGRITMEGYIPSQFVEIYSGGGVFNFEEMDASDPSMLIVVNNALASGELFNSVNGQKYVRHEDFIAFSTMNTYGLGANAKYTGREKLDLATIDRFRMCRAVISLDESLAERIIGK